ncbi:SurA N-terminal domain-containing protein [Pseudomonas sp. R5(2019)]|uniref:SurA N-terminal domain-containing protein n=1 Tax=Pseudomonas sp. R5(2019) TaxID=2697566 RepID=UPI001412B15B|nr:SurA N-terminal domain-containing protein [Pseudomonas sp. R5(2019)]NBA96738.1 peptidylprolyl isomerase [Pseudomonas sp. R5(2019)]
MKAWIALSLICCWLPLAQALPVDGPVAARVNGVEISQMRLEHYFADYLKAEGRAVTSIRSPSVYGRLRSAALDELVDKELLWQEALRQGVVIEDSVVAAEIADLRQAFGSPETFSRRLAEAGFDEQSFADYTRHEMAAQAVYAQLTRVEEPDVEQLKAFYAGEGSVLLSQSNQTFEAMVSTEQGLAWLKTHYSNRQQMLAARALLERLRAQGSIERIDAG